VEGDTDPRDTFARWNDFWRLWDACRAPVDEEFYARTVQAAGRPSVDLGFGYGRLARVLLPDIALDVSPRSVESAEEEMSSLGIALLEGDISHYDLEEGAAVSYCARNTINYFLGSDSRIEALANIRRNTKADGLLVFDVIQTTVDIRRMYDGLVGQVAQGQGYALYLVEHVVSEDPLRFSQQGIIEWTDAPSGNRIYLPPLVAEYVQPHRMAMELSWAGWSLVSCAGDFRGSALTHDARKQVWVAQNAAAPTRVRA
jgi:SAM-dependent methyltransferase